MNMDTYQGIVSALMDVQRERCRQVSQEGWSTGHDDMHRDGELAQAAASYALPARFREHLNDNATDSDPPTLWPWNPRWWKPTNRRRELVKAAALLIAEIERLDRLEKVK